MSRKEPMKIGEWARLRVLGSGGFGVVTLWQNTHTSEFIALKKCHTGTDALLSEKHKERWAKEVEIMLRLSHPNIVKAITVPEAFLPLQSSSIPILCMEFCSKDVRAVINDAKSAIQYLHQNRITHRDLKPENIVLQVNDEKVSYKLIDLGYAKELDQSSLCSSFVGTLQYLAPELFTSKTYTSSVDYWSLGLLSHEVITGVRPFLPHMPPVSCSALLHCDCRVCWMMCGTARIVFPAAKIAFHTYSLMLCLWEYTIPFKLHHNQKLQDVRLIDGAGHATGPWHPINLLGKYLSKWSLTARSQCARTPF
uniref:IkappaB kinase n=1 Tax=Timema douglasi TaxID=61478 RepID=A0A7R8Z8X0_TIMDO|nr:unnamed protein product [Timema douglasi]